MSKETRLLNVLAGLICISGAILCVVALGQHERWVYTLARVVVCGASAFACVRVYMLFKVVENPNHYYAGGMLALIAAAVAFNPISPLTLTRDVWHWVDIVGAVIMMAASIALLAKPRGY